MQEIRVKFLREIEGKVELLIIKDNKKIVVEKKEFEETLEPTGELNIYRHTKETKEKIEKAHDLVNKALVSFFMCNKKMATEQPGNYLNSMASLGSLSQEFCELMQCAPIKFIEAVQEAKKAFMSVSIEHGASFDENYHHVPKRYKMKNRENSEKIKEEHSETMSIGDMIKAKGEKK